MTDLQINEAIATACGWRLKPNYWLTPEGHEAFGWDIPDYHKDLNAMHEAEKVLMDDWQKQKSYLEWLGWDDERRIWHSTARQRAEAFLRTLNKWEE
jgi:hypothetical protein